jgi:hypothetical protein
MVICRHTTLCDGTFVDRAEVRTGMRIGERRYKIGCGCGCECESESEAGRRPSLHKRSPMPGLHKSVNGGRGRFAGKPAQMNVAFLPSVLRKLLRKVGYC